MKIRGEKFSGPKVCETYIERDGNLYQFKATAVVSYDDFDSLVQIPQPPQVVHKDGTTTKNFESPIFLEKINEYNELKTNWHIIKSLEPTEDLEWEKVDLTKPSTWKFWSEELKESFFSDNEISEIINCVSKANGISSESIDEARKRFLAQQALKERVESKKEEN